MYYETHLINNSNGHTPQCCNSVALRRRGRYGRAELHAAAACGKPAAAQGPTRVPLIALVAPVPTP